MIATGDGGSQWSSSPAPAGPTACQTPAGLPYVESSFPPSVLSMSFPSTADGFVLATAPGTPVGSQTAPVNLVKTTDGGERWALVAHLR